MENEQLIAYIKQELGKGISEEEIKNILLLNNWQETDIEEAFDSIKKQIKPKSSKKLIVIPTIIALMLLGVSAFAYFSFSKSPEKIMSQMIQNMQDVKSLEYAGQITLEVKTDLVSEIPEDIISFEEDQINSSLNFNGSFDINDLKNPNILSVVDIASNLLEKNLNIEARMVDNIGYFKLNNIPFKEFIDLSFLENEWVEIDSKDYLKDQVLDGFDDKITNEKDKIKEVVKNARIFTITKKSADEINGIKTHYYYFTIDKEKLLSFLLEINGIIEADPLTEKEIEEAKKILEEIKMPDGEVWIGKEDYLLYKIILNFNFIDEKSIIKSNITFDFNNHNKGTKTDAPFSAKTFDEMFLVYQEQEERNMLNSEIIVILEDVKAEMERSKSTTYTTKPNNNTKIKELVNKLNYLSEDHDFAIWSNGAKWCAEANLILEGAWCVDSSGYSDIGICNNKSYKCE